MAQEKSEAVVVRGVDFSDTSRIITLLTPERGRMACLARGARRKNSPLGSVLETRNRIEAVYAWKDGRGVQTLIEASTLDAYPGLRKDLDKGAYAVFCLELAGKTAHENEPSRALYDALVAGFAGLDAWTGDPRAFACWFTLRLLEAAGFAPVLNVCAESGDTLAGRPWFDFTAGATNRPAPGAERVDAGLFADLARMQAAPACPDVRVPALAFTLLWRYAARQMDTDFRSVRVLEALAGTS